ncbi:Armadillo-type fold [Pseudocohnilembus persalinus]|uniref:Armadillo-type fold n=1 Tax=Pseudocohnilembus persalinus TaxID=266149 RepID=A0A0V0QVW4_PSEPJ|nr:Armadillo-type fold [Pseudocohnilembus persalinus]|eukprot:KRX06463.1 Armadillo-type fold [Pseudocohnilembus persalinus]
MNIHGFQMQLNEAVRNADFKSDESIAMAIQTLSSFSFDHYQDYLAKFVKDCVLQYLDNRKPNIRKAAAQAGCLLCVNKGKAHAISTSIMYEILEKFLNVAISDTEDEIRQEMLSSLNGNFDFYMNSPNYLRKLFLCVNDTNSKVQELALRILCRLAGLNPSDIVPFMKKILFQYLSQLTLYEMQNEGQVIDLINLLTCFIKHGSHIVKPHAESIASILIQHLKDPTVSGHLIPSLLKCFSQLTALGEPQVMVYLHEIIPIILQAVQDKSYTVKREAAVKSLVEICKNVGYVIMPYYRYPQIMGIILGLLKNETSKEIRYECLRMIGCMDNMVSKTFSQDLVNKLYHL